MSPTSTVGTLSDILFAELTERILPYWIQNATDSEHGGFVGLIDSHGRPDYEADKSVVLNARILWTFAAASRVFDNSMCQVVADRAYAYFVDHFWDEEYGGVYWMIDPTGQPTETKKQVYGQAFAMYALTEYYRASGHSGSARRACRLFELLEDHARDRTNGGYREAFSRGWQPRTDLRLGRRDPNADKTMNTTLHLLEAYTNLYRMEPHPEVECRLKELIGLFLDCIVDQDTYHLHCFFDCGWTPESEIVSFGHDIEASWLLVEAVEELGNESLRTEVESVVVPMVDAVLADGVDNGHGLVYEATRESVTDTDRHWWPQAEALVGFVNAYELTGEKRFLSAAQDTWSFIDEWMLDRTYGEWFYRISEDGKPYSSDNKVGPWKGPYHNARACLEILERMNGTDVLEVDSSVLAGAPRY